MAKQQAILELQVDPSDLLKDAAASKKAILDLKDEQNDLNKAFKAGTIDVNKYTQETVKLEQRLKREQDTYKNLTNAINVQSGSLDAQRLKLQQLTKERNALDQSTQKGAEAAAKLTAEIKELNEAISKQEQAGGDFRRNVGNYGTAFKEAAGNINIAGTSLSDFGAKVTSFLNPITAAVGVLGGLSAAYARSTIGAKDLEFANNQLAAATTIATNAFASFISSAEDGEGIVSSLLNSALSRIDPTITAISKVAALAQDRLEDLNREELQVRDQINQRLEENQELLTELDSEQASYNDKIGFTNQIITNLRNNETELLAVLREELKETELLLALDKENEDIQTQVLQIKSEISKTERDTEKRVQAIIRKEQDLTKEYQKQQAELAKLNKLTARTGTVSTDITKENLLVSDADIGNILQTEGQKQISIAGYVQKAKTKLEKDESEKRIRQAGDEFRAKKAFTEKELSAYATFAGTVAQVAEEQSGLFKAAATTQALIDTYAAANAALRTGSEISPFFGIASAIAAVALGLKNVAEINGFAEGGWTGPGEKYKPVGIVHADEYVAPKHIVNNPAAQPHIAALERMRTMPGYADGGFVTNQNTAAANQNLALMSMVKNLPAPIIDIREALTVEQRIKNRQSVVKLGTK